jgi:N-acetylmuramoyl-L-alanine amidase
MSPRGYDSSGAVAFFLAGVLLAAARPTLAETLVVLDPGHGGSNKGAFGEPIGRHEKHLTLRVAKATASALMQPMAEASKQPSIRVLLTRYRDRYVSLRDRVLRANLAGADLFVSIHFNACESHARQGFEVFVLSDEASDREAERLASRENDRRASGGQEADLVEAIMSDVRQRALHLQSVALAQSIQSALGKARPTARDRGLRQAPFDVLMGLRMPGALVELGFIDHAREGLELGQAHVIEQLAHALARGIRAALAQAAD